MAKQTQSQKVKSVEERLWNSANKLRGKVESSEYKHVVLGLIFLKFASDKFEARRAELVEEGKEKYLEMKEFYNMQNIFFLPEAARWSFIMKNAKQEDVALKIDTALNTVEKNNPTLKGALPDNYFSRLGMDASKLSTLLDTINDINTIADEKEDIVGRVYEYFLGRFAAAEGKGGGEFYTPKCVVNLIAEMLEPYKGKIYDPCCGSGGMFVQSIKFVESHHGNKKDISVYGQEYTATTYKLAKMNLAIRGISANLGEVPADTFFKDQHPDLKADYIMANPPFNQSEWRGKNELVDDPRWKGYDVPPVGNANYGWIMHMLSKLSEQGTAGFVLANGSMSSNTSGEGDLRRSMIENDLVDCMIALPGQLFYTTQIPVCLWFMTKNKKEDVERGYRNREGETLFIDAREMGTMIDRVQKELTEEDLAKIAGTYHAWRSGKAEAIPEGRGGSNHPALQAPLLEKEGNFGVGMNLPYLKTFRKELRNNATPAEATLWTMLSKKQLEGRKFRRQHSIGNYIVDFYCPSERLAIELDGEGHNDVVQAQYDHERDLFLKSFGVKVLRFENKVVFDHPEGLLENVKQAFGWDKNHPGLWPPLLGKEGSNTGNHEDNQKPEGGGGSGRNHPGLWPPLLGKEGSNKGNNEDNQKPERGGDYQDIPGYCKSATLKDIAANEYVLTPGRYVGMAEIEDDGIPFEEKMAGLSGKLYEQMQESASLDQAIKENLKLLGYAE